MAGTTTRLDVLLVEDNPGDARLVEHHLDSPAVTQFVDDVTLTHAESLSTVGDLDAHHYDVLLLDLGLPKSSGLETLDRASELVESIPIIVLTGMQDRESALEAIQRGAQDYLSKGDLDGDRLVRALRYAVVRSRQEREIHRQRDQLEFFNSILRHDLLNGMNVIRSRANLLEDELSGPNGEHAETIADWSDDIIELTQKVRSVLETLSDEGLTDLETRELRPVLDAAADRARSLSDDCTVNIEPDDISVVADELLEDVFANLLLNAVEHGEDGVRVDVTATVGETVVTIRVADNGPGIAPDRRDRVFERGEKGTESGGSGFGLYFVASMVESYGGAIDIEASDAGGAAFVVELPHSE